MKGAGEFRLAMIRSEPQNADFGFAFGLTGGLASGKSTVARYFQGLGAQIVDADRVGHELIEPGQAAFQQIIEHFGRKILGLGGRIDRKRLAAGVFSDPQHLQTLNAILHPRIIARMQELAIQHRGNDPRSVVIIDAPLIFESGMDRTLRKVIVAWCHPEQQVERWMAKTGAPREDAEQRIKAQMPLEEKLRRADYLIDCSGSMEQTRAQAQSLYGELRRIAQGAHAAK
jgi:dephospho-CoA kinase